MQHNSFTSQKFAIAIILFGSLIVDAQAAERDCVGPITSSFYESCVLEKEIATYETSIKKFIEGPRMQPEAANLLRQSQAAWEQFRNVACNWQQLEYGGINSINAMRCSAKLTSDRARYLEGLP